MRPVSQFFRASLPPSTDCLGIIDHIRQLKDKYGGVEVQFIFKVGMDGSKGHPVFNQVIPDDRLAGSCLFSQMVALQLVARVPGKEVPLVLWDNKVIKVLHVQ